MAGFKPATSGLWTRATLAHLLDASDKRQNVTGVYRIKTINLNYAKTELLFTPMLLSGCAKVLKSSITALLVARRVILDGRVQVVLILAIIFAVYYPSLQHAPRADTLSFLAYTSGTDEFVPLVLGTYAINRGSFPSRMLFDHYGTKPSRTPAMSIISFRPLFWMSLGMCKWLFGYRFWLWQLVGLASHCVIVLLVWTVLKRMSDQISLTPLVFSIFFGVSWAGIEMVVWQCCIGNLLCLILVTLSIICYSQSIPEGKASCRWLSALLASLSLFFWEVGGAVAAVFCLVFLITPFWLKDDNVTAPIYLKNTTSGVLRRIVFRVGPSLVIVCAFAAYAAFNFIDLGLRVGIADALSYEPPRQIAKGSPFVMTFLYPMAYENLYWLSLMFLPSLAVLSCGGRIEGIFRTGPISLSNWDFWCVIGVLLLGSIIVSALSVRGKHIRLRMYSLLVPLFGILAAYTFMIFFWRVMERGLYFSLANAAHYAYVWGLIAVLIAGFALAHAERFGGRFGYLVSCSTLVLAVVMAYHSGDKTYAVNVSQEKWSRPRMKLLKKVEELIIKHGNESDFSFAVDEWYPNTRTYVLPSRPRLIQAMYYTHYNAQSPKYVISLPPAREHATLVQEGYCGYNIIKLDQHFVAVRQDLGRIDFLNGRLADIKVWPYFISGNTIVTVHEEILKRGGYTSQYKMFTYKGGVVAANVCLGEVDPTTELIGVRELPPFLFVGRTSEEVLARVDARSEK